MYYTVVNPNDEFDLRILWLPEEICKGRESSGYIVQHMHIESQVPSIKNDDYWECWKVISLSLSDSRGGYSYDDSWCPLPAYMAHCFLDEISNSKSGTVVYYSEVYFIPKCSLEYEEVEKWKPVQGSPANELPMTYHFNCKVSSYYLCDRYKRWDYKKLLQINEEVESDNHA